MRPAEFYLILINIIFLQYILLFKYHYD